MGTKKFLWIIIACLCINHAMAQETYENTKLIDNDLNGTARYVGMGGAMEALGADLSTISSNPAGVGLFRRSSVSTSFGFVSQQDAKKFGGGDKTNFSFDQIGFVYSMKSNTDSWINFAFNYHKSRNFNMLVSAADQLTNASQNKLTYQKYRNQIFGNSDDATYSQVDYLYMRNLLYNASDSLYYNYPAQDYKFNRSTEGYIGEYDFNISGSLNNRLFLGLTLGLHDVNYKHYSVYSESFAQNIDNLAGISLTDYRKIEGVGVDVKFGAIYCPIENSPFRIGAYIQTPTIYDLTTRNTTTLSSFSVGAPYVEESYDFKVYTPWKFGLSLGHTIGECFAMGATYEYADYTCTKTRINTGGHYDDWYGEYYDESENDRIMNKHTDKTLKGVSTLKLGVEFKPIPEFAVRLGYNYVSSLYKKNGYKDETLWSPGTYYSSQTDYTNWKDTNRLTAGLGYQGKHFNIDLAYQYSATNGDFHPFLNYYDDKDISESNKADAVKVTNKRHQLLLTLGYRF